MHDVRLIQQLSVDVNVPINELEVVARQSDEAFHKMLMVGIRIFEDDDVAALQWPVWQKLFIPRTGAAKNEFVHQEMIAHEQRALHRGRGNLERLNDKAGAKEGEDDRDQE